MDWDNFRYFLELARAERLVTAARRLGVDHTTVARRVNALEKQIGQPYFCVLPKVICSPKLGDIYCLRQKLWKAPTPTCGNCNLRWQNNFLAKYALVPPKRTAPLYCPKNLLY